MRLPKILQSKVKLTPSGPLHASSTGLLSARDKLQESILTRRDKASMELAICAVRSYVFHSVLNQCVIETDAIRAALEDVDILIPLGKLRLATVQLEFPGRTTLPTPLEKMSLTINELAQCMNIQRYADGTARILAHLADGQADEVMLLAPLEEGISAEYYVNYLTRVNGQLRQMFGWSFTACISEQFDDLSKLSPIYFSTRQTHELLLDAKTEGEVWLAEEARRIWAPKPDAPETIWWVEREYVMEHYANPDLNISFLARQFGIGAGYAGHKFREITGIGLLELIHRCRLHDLERRTNAGESVKAAAAAVGYSNLLTMQRARERYGHE